MSLQPGASVLIPTYNGYARVAALLENIRQRTPSDIPMDLVVCDDSGKDSHRNVVRPICERFGARFIFNEKNKGVAGAWNTLVRSSDKEVAVLLNDDVLIANDWLAYIHYAVTQNPKVGAFSLNCKFIQASDTAEILKGPDAKVIPLNVHMRNGVLVRNERYSQHLADEDGQPGRVMCPAGCAFGFRRETYDLVGGFDERYFAFYEETDFGVACAYRGMPAYVLSVPSTNYHIWSATFGSAPEIDAGRVMRESRVKFVEKWKKILGFNFSDAPDVHKPIMDKIPNFEVKWLGLGRTQKSATL